MIHNLIISSINMIDPIDDNKKDNVTNTNNTINTIQNHNHNHNNGGCKLEQGNVYEFNPSRQVKIVFLFIYSSSLIVLLIFT